MGTLTVWKFDSPNGADDATDVLRNLASKKLITIHDAATVRWEEGKKKPKTRQLDQPGRGRARSAVRSGECSSG